jgi:hypothetical protein
LMWRCHSWPRPKIHYSITTNIMGSNHLSPETFLSNSRIASTWWMANGNPLFYSVSELIFTQVKSSKQLEGMTQLSTSAIGH